MSLRLFIKDNYPTLTKLTRRMKMRQHKHAELIHKWAEGYPIQKLAVLCCDRKVKHWEDMGDTAPMWFEDDEYRVRPLGDDYVISAEETNEVPY